MKGKQGAYYVICSLYRFHKRWLKRLWKRMLLYKVSFELHIKIKSSTYVILTEKMLAATLQSNISAEKRRLWPFDVFSLVMRDWYLYTQTENRQSITSFSLSFRLQSTFIGLYWLIYGKIVS